MKPADPTRRIRTVRLALGALLAAPIALLLGAVHGWENAPVKKPAGKEVGPTPVEVCFVGGGGMKLAVLDERLEMCTAYGRLLVPVADIRRVEFGWRLADEVARKVEVAITDLGDESFKRRQAAFDDLAALEEQAYPALLKAAKDSDMEVARRANRLLDRVRRLPAERLEFKPHDVVHTTDMKLTGRLAASALRVRTRPFGDQLLKLADLCSLCAPGAGKVREVDAQPDPGNLARLQAQVGQAFHFRVTGAVPGTAGAWGTGTYTIDSALAVAAVHAGVLRTGQTGVVKVTVLGPVGSFTSSTQNGITTSGYGQYPGYRIER